MVCPRRFKQQQLSLSSHPLLEIHTNTRVVIWRTTRSARALTPRVFMVSYLLLVCCVTHSEVFCSNGWRYFRCNSRSLCETIHSETMERAALRIDTCLFFSPWKWKLVPFSPRQDESPQLKVLFKCLKSSVSLSVLGHFTWHQYILDPSVHWMCNGCWGQGSWLKPERSWRR